MSFWQELQHLRNENVFFDSNKCSQESCPSQLEMIWHVVKQKLKMEKSLQNICPTERPVVWYFNCERTEWNEISAII